MNPPSNIGGAVGAAVCAIVPPRAATVCAAAVYGAVIPRAVNAGVYVDASLAIDPPSMIGGAVNPIRSVRRSCHSMKGKMLHLCDTLVAPSPPYLTVVLGTVLIDAVVCHPLSTIIIYISSMIV